MMNSYTNNNYNKTMDINRTVARKPRTKLKSINNFLMCCLCKGYIIEATAITDCLHSFCRSCIVKHLTDKTFCPKCGIQNVSKANLRPDDIIKALVYKVVPALYQSETERTKKFNKLHNIQYNGSTSALDKNSNNEKLDENLQSNQHFFSPDEPISLSLTYHAESLVGSGVPITAPPINYLQCPAAVTVHHLKRFVSAKYGIDIERDVNIEIICEDEVLPEDFTLMDVAYCFNWTRACPMQLMYRIFLHANNIDNHHGNLKDIVLPVENNRSQRNNNNNNRKQTDNKNDFNTSNGNCYTNNMNDNRSGNNNGRSYINSVANMNNEFLVPSTDFKRLRSNASASSVFGTNIIGSTSISTKDINTKKQTSNKSGTVTHDGVKQFDYKTNFSSTLTTSSHIPANKTEEKREKHETVSLNSQKMVFNTISNTALNTNPKEVNKFYEKNQQHHVEKDDLKLRYENVNIKKCYSNTKKNNVPQSVKNVEKSNKIEETKKEIPKLRIELPTLKSNDKFETGVSKEPSVHDVSKPKIILKLPSPIEKRSTPVPSANVDVREYAKNIGLLPVSELQERKKKESDRQEVSHKKRKKAKHSKEPNGKKRKIHAEVSSLTLDDEVKLKVKISKPPSKHEKRSNSIDESKVSVAVSESPKNQVTPSKEVTTTSTVEKSQLATSSILRTVRHKPMVFIPNVDKNISEEQDSISDIVKRVQGPVAKSPVIGVEKAEQRNSPVQSSTSRNSPMQTSSSPVLNIQQKSQQQQKQVLNTLQKSINPIDALAFQTLSKVVQASTKMLMPPFSPASLFDIRMQRMSSSNNVSRTFSPRPTNSASPLSLSMPISSHSMQQKGKPFTALPTQSHQQQRPILKRPAGYDMPTPMPKTPRINHMDMADKKNIIRKQTYAPIIDLPPSKKSPEPRSYTKAAQSLQQNSDVKKPLPRLIAPSSISVTRVGDTQTAVPVPQINRPAVEILKIPSTVPAIDQKPNSVTNKPLHKTTRPPPGTIPLFKIQKSQQTGKAISTQANTNKPRTESEKALDLSLSPTSGGPNKNLDMGAVIDLTENNEAGDSKKSSEERQNITQNVNNAPTKNNNGTNVTKNERGTKPVMPGLTALVIPKLHEISKNRNLVRQQNLSVRNIPNPSALAFRNQGMSVTNTGQPKVVSTSLSKLNEKVQQLKEIQQRQRIAPED